MIRGSLLYMTEVCALQASSNALNGKNVQDLIPFTSQAERLPKYHTWIGIFEPEQCG